MKKISLIRIQTKVNHYKENWMNAQKRWMRFGSL